MTRTEILLVTTLLIVIISTGAIIAQLQSMVATLSAKLDEISQKLEAIEAIKEKVGEIPATITVIGPWAGPEMDAFMPVLERFERMTGIKVIYKIYRAEDLATILPAQFEANSTPGDVIFMWGWFIVEQAKKGHVVDVTDLINEADFLPGALDAVKLNGRIYGGVWTGKVKPGFWYRKSFFNKYNLTVPETWDEFVNLLEQIKGIEGIKAPIVTGDGVGWPISDVVEHFLITYGGPQLQRDLIAGKVKWTDPEVRQIFEERIVPLLRKGYFSEPIEWTTALELWWKGDYALYFMGSWITGMVEDPSDLGVFSLPGNKGLVFAPDYFFIPVYTKNLEAAKEFFKFLCSAEAQRLQVAQGGHLATNVNVPLDAYPPVDREVAKLLVGKEVLSDLDDSIGGEFQPTFWDQLKLLWVNPDALDSVLEALQEKAPKG